MKRLAGSNNDWRFTGSHALLRKVSADRGQIQIGVVVTRRILETRRKSNCQATRAVLHIALRRTAHRESAEGFSWIVDLQRLVGVTVVEGHHHRRGQSRDWIVMVH